MTLWVGASHGESPPCQIWWHGHCSSGDMFLVVEEENSRCYRFNPPLLFISRGHGLKAHGISYN